MPVLCRHEEGCHQSGIAEAPVQIGLTRLPVSVRMKVLEAPFRFRDGGGWQVAGSTRIILMGMGDLDVRQVW